MKKEYDLLVIGSGSGASGAARRCKKAGWTVAMIDERPFGGTCALRGCDMKKILAAPAEAMDFAQRMQGRGLNAQIHISWPELMAFKRLYIQGYPERFEAGLIKEGIDTLHGTARFVSANELEVDGRILKAKYILIATGAVPRRLDIPGEELIKTSEDFLDMDEMPGEIVFLGGGMISMEFAHIAARAGASVTVVESASRALLNFDKDLAGLLEEKSKEIGIRFLYDTKVDAVQKSGENLTVRCTQAGKEIFLPADMAVHGAGRVANIKELDLESGDIEAEAGGILVNRYMQSVNNRIVYAAGDAADTPAPKLTPVAGMESFAAGRNMLQGNTVKPDYSAVPTVLYTMPRLASVGLSLRQAQEAGYEAAEHQTDMSGWYTYRRTHAKYAMAKIIVEKHTKKILGAHLAGVEAEGLVNYFAMAIAHALGTDQMKKQAFAYPSAASDIQYMF